MIHSDFLIREITSTDNKAIATLIRSVLDELHVPKVGTAYADKATDTMFETYQKENASYYIIEYQNKIVGGAGFSPLENFKNTVCELQKMYFSPIIRGKGLGSTLISHCLTEAKKTGFTQCYLETMPYMIAAKKLYIKNGFKEIDHPLGDTGHYSCNVWMLKDL